MNRSRCFTHRRTLAACAAAMAVVASAAPALAAPASLNLRIEGETTTVFEGPVTSDGHVVQPATGQQRLCDGTNGGANAQPGPTPTSTLDDGARLGSFVWDGDYSESFSDYLVNRIGPDSSNSSQFFGQYVNSQLSQVGGCQEIVKTGDEVLWAFDAFSKENVLKLSGPTTGRTNQPVVVRVTNGANGAPLGGATVRGATTAGDGTASLMFSDPGVYRLKAERPDSVRSNALSVCIDPPDVESCTSTDRAAPTLRIPLPRFASDLGASRTFPVNYEGVEEAGGSGITGYAVSRRRVGEPAFASLVSKTILTRTLFRGEPGSSYQFQVSATDRAGNRGSSTSDAISVPFDDRDPQLSFADGWRKLKRSGAWGRFTMRSSEKGATASIPVDGARFAVIGRRLKKGGRLRMSILKRSKVKRLKGTSKHREVLYVSARLPKGPNTLKLKALDDAAVEIDAVAVIP